MIRRRALLEGEGHAVETAEIGLELGRDVDAGRLPRRVLHHEEQLGHDLDHVSRLKDKIAFYGARSAALRLEVGEDASEAVLVLAIAGETTAGDVGLTPRHARRGRGGHDDHFGIRRTRL